jgi:hypothetical protein
VMVDELRCWLSEQLRSFRSLVAWLLEAERVCFGTV